MKKLFLLVVLSFSLVGFALAQEREIYLSNSEKQDLMDEVTGALKALITSFDGQYIPGTTIDRVYQINDSELIFLGKVNYCGQVCGDVCTDYKLTVIVEGSEAYKRACINTPYCGYLFHSILNYEWDCSGKKSLVGGNLTPDQKRAVVSVILKLLTR